MPRKILVVDDNLDTRELTHLHLTTEGFAIVVASDGREGLYMAVAEQPDRPWGPRRPVFGTIRYMSRDGMSRKFDVDRYIARVRSIT